MTLLGEGNRKVMQQQSAQGAVEKRYRVLLIIWAAMLMNIGLFALVSYFAQPGALADDGGNNFTLLLVLTLMGLTTVALSFILKKALLARAESGQKLDSVQVAYVVAFALCESAAIFGMVALFATGEFSSYIMFIIAAVGILLHMPRRDHLLAASYK